MNSADRLILRVEKEYTGKLPINAKPFCVRALGAAIPSNPDSAYGKKVIQNKLLGQKKGQTIDCDVAECTVSVDRESLEVVEGVCRLAGLCLKAAWENRSENGQQNGPLEEIERFAASGPGSYICPSPTCEFSAGWSEDGVAGTVGTCVGEEPAAEV